MATLTNPNFSLDAAALAKLQRAVIEEVNDLPRTMAPRERKKLSDDVAIRAVSTLLKQLEPAHEVLDANVAKTNNPGYDFLIDGRVRVQVKGTTDFEVIVWRHKPDPEGADLGYDVLVLVDSGVMLRTNFGRAEKYNIPTKTSVDFYVFPIDVVRSEVRNPRALGKMGVLFFLWKRPLRPGCKEEGRQFVEMPSFRDRFDYITALL